MRRVGVAVVVAVVALAASACGGGQRVRFSTFSRVCGLLVPMPRGFHRRFWGGVVGGGVTVSDGAIERGAPIDWSDGSKRVALDVGWRVGGTSIPRPPRAPQLRLPITLGELERDSGGLPSWGGSGQIGNWDQACGVGVWLGPHASAADRSAVLSALQGIKQEP